MPSFANNSVTETKVLYGNKQQQNNTTTINFFPEKGFKNLEDTAKKARAILRTIDFDYNQRTSGLGVCTVHISSVPTITNKLFYCRQTVRHAISNKILSTAAPF